MFCWLAFSPSPEYILRHQVSSYKTYFNVEFTPHKWKDLFLDSSLLFWLLGGTGLGARFSYGSRLQFCRFVTIHLGFDMQDVVPFLNWWDSNPELGGAHFLHHLHLVRLLVRLFQSWQRSLPLALQGKKHIYIIWHLFPLYIWVFVVVFVLNRFTFAWMVSDCQLHRDCARCDCYGS